MMIQNILVFHLNFVRVPYFSLKIDYVEIESQNPWKFMGNDMMKSSIGVGELEDEEIDHDSSFF